MLIPAKLSRPLRLENTLLRDRLIARLSNSNLYRLVLVTSPAGYGKTTLIAQWAAEKSGLGWYSLDDSDNYPERFASYFMAAVQQATDGHCVRSEALAQNVSTPASTGCSLSCLLSCPNGSARCRS